MHPSAPPRTRTLYLVGPESVASWFRPFAIAEPHDVVVFTGENGDWDPARLRPLLAARELSTVVVLASHATLARDHEVTRMFRARGRDVIGPSRESVALGSDKLRMKRFFARNGIPSPGWATGTAAAVADGRALVVVKRRHGTQSEGMRLEQVDECVLRDDEFCELYVEGVEYSVVVYRDRRHELVFPPIWKGPTTQDLVPPWRRLRVCPDPDLPPEREQRLRELALTIARSIRLEGHLEVEYLVSATGEVLVLEINPRIAGTMRLAAMATRLPIFSLHRLDVDGAVGAIRCAAEIPYSGPPISDARRGVFATSRVTAAGRTFAEVYRKLEAVGSVPPELAVHAAG